jgi:hypothetical protein
MQSGNKSMRAIPGLFIRPRFLTAVHLGILFSAAIALSAQSLPPQLRQTLTAQLKASGQSLSTLEAGGVTAYSIDLESPSRIKLVGMIRIWATPESFVKSYRNIEAFESVPGVSMSRKLHVPPKESDLDQMSLSAAEAEELRACRPGSCTFKIDDEGLRYMQEALKRGSPGDAAQASAAIRRLWLQKLKKYQANGNGALPVYHDTPDTFSVENGLKELLSDSAPLRGYAPQLDEYLRKYPRSVNRSTENFFYWQSGSFGLKPVQRVSHVAMQQFASTHGDAFVIASKMLFASHYFRSGLEFRYLIPGQDQKTGGMHYLVLVQSSEVDGMEGWQGRLLRPVVVAKSLAAMEKYLGAVKERVERENKLSGAAPDRIARWFKKFETRRVQISD